MNSTDTPEICEARARETLALLSRHALAPTAENYAVCYRYVCGDAEHLNTAIDTSLAQGRALSQDAMDTLYRKFVAPCDDERLTTLQAELLELLTDIRNSIIAAGGEATHFESSLRSYRRKLDGALHADELQRIVEALREDTESMHRASERLRLDLGNGSQEVQRLREELEQAKEEALTDPLTGLANRKAFSQRLLADMEWSSSAQRALCLLMIDIDHFKQVNDRYGHLIGDKVLTFVAKTLRQGTKGQDFIARFGGEEFAVLLPETPLHGAEQLADTLRAAVEHIRFVRKNSGAALDPVTISIGVARFRTGERAESFIARADAALYKAKSGGRNRIVAEHAL